MDKENIILNKDQLIGLLKRISFHPSCVDMGWKWEVRFVSTPNWQEGNLTGWLVRTAFQRPDTDTGEMGTGFGRWEFIQFGTSESGAFKTCWLLAELVVRHELMEAFCVDGKRLFDPHKTVDELTANPRK